MATGWEMLGEAFGGDSEKAYQEGRALGAKTEEALAAARERVQKNAARQTYRQSLEAAGVKPDEANLLSDAALGDINLAEQFGGLQKRQEIGLRERASDPNLSFSDRNIALQGVASAPVDRFQKIGRGVDDRFNEEGVVDLGEAFADTSGTSAQMQLLDRFGFPSRLEDNAQKDLALSTLRDTFGVGDAGGVPFSFSKSPYASGGPRNLAPGGAPAPAAAPAAPAAASTVAPMVPTSAVTGNVAAVAAAKERGSAAGRAEAGLPSTFATIDKFSSDIDEFLKAPGFDGVYGNLQGSAPGAIISGLMSQDIADAQGKLGNLGAQAFLASIQKMRGFGQLSNQEGAKVEAALTEAVNTKIGSPAARAAWAKVQLHLEELKRVAQIEANMGQAQAPPGPGGDGQDYSGLWK